MAEIRSTIDLMMERTRGMSLSDEEKDKLQREELTKRAKGFRRRLVEGTIEGEEILAILEQETEDVRKTLETALWSELIEFLPADQSILTFLELMERLPQGRAKRSVLEEIRSSLKDLGKMKAKDRKKLASVEKKRLAAFGISGTAVVPKLPDEQTAGSKTAAKMEGFKRRLGQNTSL